jgi:hypothetical protein
MDEFEQMIRDAEIMLRSANAQQRERGRENLRAVIGEADGSSYAKRARDLLSKPERVASEFIDPELDELTCIWPSIQGFDDHRLCPFLKRLGAYPSMAVPLRTDVIRDLRRWIVDVLPQVKQGAPPAQIASLNDFVAAVRGVAAYEALPEFGELRDGLFHLRLQECATLVDQALANWEVDVAQQLLDELVPLPDAFKANVERLQADVYEADRLQRTVEGLLRQLATVAPTNWIETRLQAESLEQLKQYLSDLGLPWDWQSRVEEGRSRLSAFIEQFVHRQALTAVTSQQLRSFWTEFNRLPAGFVDGRWQLRADWFQRGWEALSGDARRDVERARQPDELTAIANSLRAQIEGLPPDVAKRLSTMADNIGKNAVAWKAMQDGQVFELPVSTELLAVPGAWQSEAARYAAWLEQIEGALNGFNSAQSPAVAEDFQDGLRLADEILAQAPNHALAHKLKLESGLRLSCYQLDRALISWKLKTFFELFKTHNPGGIYAALVDEKDVLVELRALTKQEPLTDWKGAEKWWAAWRATSKRLPSAKPDAFSEALAGQTAKRLQEWYATLGKLLQEKLAPQEYEAAAASLDEEGDTSLQTYQRELRLKATIGRIEQQIKNAQLAEAEEELNRELPAESTDAARLRTQLQIARLRGLGAAATAEFLSSDWENVKSYIENPQRLLLETIQAVWTKDLQDSVLKLSRLLSRVLAREGDEGETTEALAEWQTWLEIEDGLLGNFSSGGVRHLADYLRIAQPSDLLDQRLKKILRQWQAENNTVMLAWAYQAFDHKSTATAQFYRKADDLVEESDEVAEHVLRVLGTREELELNDLKPLDDSLLREEERWRSLDDLLSLLPHPVEHRSPSAKFAQAKMSVVELTRILTALGRLYEADLREESAHQEFDDVQARTRRLDGIASRARLLEEFERLRPLAEDLFSMQYRIVEIAERCRSKDALYVLESGLFNQLSAYVRRVVDIFVKAEAKGSAMWGLVSDEYESLIYREACMLLAPSVVPQLDKLADLLADLNTEEITFIQAIDSLEDRDRQPKVPSGGAFDPQSHLNYLKLIPTQAPRSLKVYHRFDRARRDTLQIILEAPESRQHLPVWVRDYLDKGVPACANKR